MKPTTRNRIVEHVRVRAGDLAGHPDNFRLHDERQRRALAASYREIGFARSLLGFRNAEGRIQLIDGHLRRDLDPDLEVTVEVLDVNEEEARQLLLTIDPLAALAGTDGEAAARLGSRTSTDERALEELWESLWQPAPEPPEESDDEEIAEQFLILVRCRDEAEQAGLLRRFAAEGIDCKPLIG